MKTEIRTVLLVGDNGENSIRIRIISELLHDSLRASLKKHLQTNKTVVEINHSDDFTDHLQISENDGSVIMKSPFFPFGVRMISDFSDSDWQDTPAAKECDIVVFIEGYPFTSGSLINRLHGIKSHLEIITKKNIRNMIYRVVFYYDENQRFGSTDIVGIEQALKQAPQELMQKIKDPFIKKLPDFKTYKNPFDWIEVTAHEGRLLEIAGVVAGSRFGNWVDDLIYFPQDYKIILETEKYSKLIDSNYIHQSALKYEKVRGSKNLVQSYVNHYFKESADAIHELAAKAYENNIESIRFWDMEKDIRNLNSRIDNCYNEFFSNELRRYTRVYECPENQAAYQKLLVKGKMDVRFIENINEFIRKKLMEHIRKYLKEKEDILFRAFDRRKAHGVRM